MCSYDFMFHLAIKEQFNKFQCQHFNMSTLYVYVQNCKMSREFQNLIHSIKLGLNKI